MKVSKSKIFSRLPQKLSDSLMPFQREGLEYAVNKNGRCLIADEMGLGKTIQAIAVATYYKQEWPLLIIVPSSLRYCWIEEFEKWLPDVNPGEINLIQSGNDASGIGSASVTIVTFGLLSKATSNIVREALMAKEFQVVIVDESHYIRNIKTISAKTVVPLIKAANRRILLSGTPALARPVELYPQIDAIAPDKFGSWWSYTARYCDAKLEWIGKVKRRNVNGASNLQELQQKLSDTLMIRREKDMVLTQLPPKQRQKILFELKHSELTKDIKKTFEELRPLLRKGSVEKLEELTGGSSEDVKDTNMLSLIQRLYQLSGEAKIGPAKEYVEMLCENPNLKFLVFAYHRAMMNGLSQSLYDKNIKFIRIDGETPPSERPHLVHQFQSDPDTRVAVLSILAAGVGLTLTAATVVVFAEMYWTPGVMVQCEDRAHRIGQSSCVAVHYLVAKDTMDEWVWSAVCKKTIVTSTTLTGKKKPMQADAGDQYQVDVLSSAEAWVPNDNQEMDLSSYFQTHQDSDQKSILDFFSSSQESKSSVHQNKTPTLGQKNKRSSLCMSPVSPSRPSFEVNSPPSDIETTGNRCSGSATELETQQTQDQNPRKRFKRDFSEKHLDKKCTNIHSPIIVIDCDDDEDDFVSGKSPGRSTSSLNKKQNSSCKKRKLRKSSGGISKSRLFDLWNKLDSDNDCCVITDVIDTEDSKSCIESKAESVVETNTSNTEHVTPNIRHGKASSSKTGSKATPGSKHKGKCIINEGKSNSFSQKWSCSSCTYLNHKDLVYCEICETPRKRKISSSGSTFTDNEITCKDLEVNEKDSGDKRFQEGNVEKEFGKETSATTELADGVDSTFAQRQVMLGKCRTNVIDCHMTESDKEETAIGKQGNNVVNTIEKEDNEDEITMGKYGNNTNNDLVMDLDKDDLCYNRNSSSLTNDCIVNNDIKEMCGNDDKVLRTPTSAIDKPDTDNATPGSSNSKRKFRFKSKRTSEKLTESSFVEKNEKEDLSDSDKHGCVGIATKDKLELNGNEPFVDTGSKDEVGNSKTQGVPSYDGSSAVKTIMNDPMYTMFKYQCSKYTGRIYLYTQADEALQMNFIPLDVEMGNLEALPDLLQHPTHLRLVQKFVREWQSLTETKRRLLIKSCRLFVSPIREYEELKSCKTVNTQRHQTKIDTAMASRKAAADVGGSVRVISKSSGVLQGTDPGEVVDGQQGVLQALTEDGTPLCLQCHTPYVNDLLEKSSICSKENAWQTRFCSQKCSKEYWTVTNNDYCRDMVYEAERGVCQLCQFDAHSLYRQIRDTSDQQKRAELITKSKFNGLALKTKQQMTKKPVPGQFWHVDHIKPVWEGGGQCDIDNLRTLCVVCHQKVTAKQAGKRAIVRKLGSAVQSGGITAFFQRS